jgi:hypothetical protein
MRGENDWQCVPINQLVCIDGARLDAHNALGHLSPEHAGIPRGDKRAHSRRTG